MHFPSLHSVSLLAPAEARSTLWSSSELHGFRKTAAHGLCAVFCDRSSRMWLWLVAIVAMNALDLVLTLNCMCTTGMFESNPIVHQLAKSPAPILAITCFKLATVLTGVGILFKLRRRREAELAAGMQLLVLTLLMVRWLQYLGIDHMFAALSTDPSWIQLR
jgi:hypothetical protein